MYSVSEKVALVTGGSRGIGLALCRHILEGGGKVGLNGRSETQDALGLQEEFGKDRVALIWADISNPEEASRAVEEVASAFGRLDVLVHAAGGPAPGKITELSQAAWMETFDIHVHPVFHLFKAAHRHLKKEGGAVVLVSSVAGLRGCPGTVAYQTVKGALIPLARALAFDHGPENIRVNVIAPGIIRTRFHASMTDEAKAHNIGNRIPLRREGTVEDVARATMDLIENDFITGEVLTIDGGMSMRVTG